MTIQKGTAETRMIIRQYTRILTPSDFKFFKSELNLMYQIIVEVLLHTGFRIVEFWAFVEHPEWYHRNARVIDLPPEGSAKKKRAEYKERTIRLSVKGCEAVENLIANLPDRRSRFAPRSAFHRAAVKTIGDTFTSVKNKKTGKMVKRWHVNPKMFRKTIISWLMECRKELNVDDVDIASSAGHSTETLRIHYRGVGFEARDKFEILELLKGWGGN